MDEIIAVSIVNVECNLENHKKKEKVENYNAIRKYNERALPYDLEKNQNINIVKVDNESALLNYLLAKMVQYDPDVILGYDLYSDKLENVITRCQWNKVKDLNRLGRINRYKQDLDRNQMNKCRYLAAGRLLCDVY